MYSSENYYIFFEIYSTNPNSQLSNVEIFFTNNFISTIIRACPIPIPAQIIYNVENEDDDSMIYQVNKSITIFNLNSNEKHAMRIRFFYVDSYIPVIKQYFNETELETQKANDIKNETFTEFITKTYRRRRTYLIKNDAEIGLRLLLIHLQESINRLLSERKLDETELETIVQYETADSLDDFTIFNLPESIPTIESEVVDNNMTYKLKVRKPEIIRGPTNVDYQYRLRLYNLSEIEDIKDIDSLTNPALPIVDIIIERNESDSIYDIISIDGINEENTFYVALSAISNEESPQILDYDIITLKVGKYYGETYTENYTPTNVFRKPTPKKKSKWWIAIVIIGILAVLGAIVFFVCKNLNKEDDKKKIEKPKKKEEKKIEPEPQKNEILKSDGQLLQVDDPDA